MVTDMNDPMFLESVLAARAREKQDTAPKNGVRENSFMDLPASGAIQVAEQVVGMNISPPAVTDSPGGDDMSKHGDGAQSEAAQEEDLALPMKPSEGDGVIELPFEGPTVLSPNSGNFNGIAAEGTAEAEKKRKNWVQDDTNDLLQAVLNTKKVCVRMEQSTGSDSYWDFVAKAVPGRTGNQCRGRMDTLKKSYNRTKKYCDEQEKEFQHLNEDDFGKLKGSPRLTEKWYNWIRNYWLPKKSNGAGSSSASIVFVSDSTTSDLQPCVFPDGIALDEPASVAKEGAPAAPVI